MNFVAIDFETANAKRDSACAIGITVVRDGVLMEQHDWLIRPPELYFSPFNVAIHGIREEDVYDQPDFRGIWPRLEPVLAGRAVVAHNAAFDISVLRGCLNAYGLPHPDFSYVCTCRAAKKHLPQLGNHKLPTVAEFFGVTLRHHRAGSDAAACAQIAIRLCQLTDTADLAGLLPPKPVRA